MRFKKFLENTAHKFEHLLTHIAEEELIACKVHKIVMTDSGCKVIADCQDVVREPGFQKDLTDKLMARLKLHPLQHFNTLKCKVFHENVDAFKLDGK